MKIQDARVNLFVITILVIYIISPIDLLPLVEIDDGFAGIIIGWLLE